VSPGLDRVRQAAEERKQERFIALLHHVDEALLGHAYRQLRREAAPGIDGVTWQAYGEDLDRNLTDLRDRIHRGAYRALPSRRQYIAKPDGRQRPLGIAALEDKIVQRAVVEVLNAIYEADFLGFSYGFRPGRGQHQALDALAVAIDRRPVNWVLDADIAAFFDTVDHERLIGCVERRVGDRRVIRLLRKWLKAGVMEDGRLMPTEVGTPQGAVISPLLANIYLHYVFDLWAQDWRQRHARGSVVIVRYADDIIVGFEHESDARRFLAELRQRLEEHALALHPDKTRLIEFGRRAAASRARQGLGKPESFNFLGFTHICGRARSGAFQLVRKTRRDRLRAKLRELGTKLRSMMHVAIPEQGRWLGTVLRGYFAYHAVPTNQRSLKAFRYHVSLLWRDALRRRSQRARVTYDDLTRLANQWLPHPRILHPWPSIRFAARHPRWEPGARIGHAGFCAGGAQ
jgi:group II intron reverse transcriptase/maturase